MTFIEMQQEYGRCHERMQEIAKAGFDATTREEFDRLDKRQDEILGDLKRAKRTEQLKAEEIRGGAGNPPTTEDRGEEGKKKYRSAFLNYVRRGAERLKEDESALLRTGEPGVETRDFGEGTGNLGGYLVPTGFMPELEKALLFYGGVMDNARVIRTASGQDIPWPTVNDTTRKARIISENSTVTTPDTSSPFGTTTLKAFKYATEEIPVSIELLQDAFIDVEAVLRDLLADAFGRGQNTDFTTGSGTGAPQGVVTAATLGATAAAAATVAYNDFVNLEHGLDRAYRPFAKFMMHDLTFKASKKIVDGFNRPLWNFDGMKQGFPPTILGYPYVINNDMAQLSAGESPAVQEKTVLFGNFMKYIVRIVMEMRILRLVERQAHKGQVSFIGYMRADGRVIDAGTHPIVYLQHPVS
jgi:HK97 family phage major capsid protein